MLPVNPIEQMDVYASNSQYIQGPSPAQQAQGTIPLDTLPADWWNWLWKSITERINQASEGMESIYDEVMSVLTAASIEPSQLQSDQLLNAIKALARVTGTSAVAGAVKSSADSGKVSIDENGIMTVNGLGTPTSLNTMVKNIVGAINEILADYEQHKTTTDSLLQGLGNGKAPTNHASEETTYGAGTASTYGHVKLSDSYDTETPKSANESVGASQKALALAYEALKGMIASSGGLPTHLGSDPVLNATAGQSGTFEVTESTAGLYYLAMKGGNGGNGGRNGGIGGNGQLTFKVIFLFAGTYNYIVATNGSAGGGGGRNEGIGGAAGSGYPLRGGSGGNARLLSVKSYSSSSIHTLTRDVPGVGGGGVPPAYVYTNPIMVAGANTIGIEPIPIPTPAPGLGGSGGTYAQNYVEGTGSGTISSGGGGGAYGSPGGAGISRYRTGGGGGGGGGNTAFYKEDAVPHLLELALGGGGGGGGQWNPSTEPKNASDGGSWGTDTSAPYLKLWKLV